MLDYEYAMSLEADASASDLRTLSHCVLGVRKWDLNEGLANVLDFLVDRLDGESAVKAFARRFPVKRLA